MSKQENKTKPTSQSVDEFLDTVEHPTRKADAYTLKEMMERITGCPSIMWGPSIIGYDEYHYKYDSGREGDFMMVGFSPRKANLSIYLMPGYGAYDSYIERLGKVKTGKACLYINKLADIDLNVLEETIQACIDNMRQKFPKST